MGESSEQTGNENKYSDTYLIWVSKYFWQYSVAAAIVKYMETSTQLIIHKGTSGQNVCTI